MIRFLTALVITLSACALPVRAQENTGSIRGSVRDAATREPLAGANVIVVGTSSGAAAGADGSFLIRALPAGTYRIQASVVGYTPVVLTDVVVAAGRQNQVEFSLQQLPIDIGEVTVQAEYFRKTADETVSAQSLSAEEIRRAPGAQEDVVRAISVLPGVVQVSAGRNDLIVRGGAASENLYVVDGLEIPNINHFGTQGATGGPLSFINLDFVRDVTFSTGGFGVRYGDKLSSVLDISLKDGRTDRFGGKATVSATQFGLNAEGPFNDRGTFLFSARRSYLDLLFRAAGFGFVPEYWDFLGKARYAIDEKNTLSFLAIGALDNVRFFNDTQDKRYGNSLILGNSQNQYVSDISLRSLLDHGFVTVALGRTYVAYDFLQTDSLLRPIFSSASKEGETSLRADAVFLFGHAYELSAGVQGRLSRVRGTLEAGPNPYYPSPVIAPRSWDTVGVKAAGYAQLSKRFFDAVQLAVGARVDYFDLIDKPLAFAPRASVAWSITSATTLGGSAGVYTQAPSSIWIVSNAANAGLEHIRVNQVVISVDHLLRADTRVRIEAYMKNYLHYPASLTRPWLVMANTGAGYGGAEEGFASFGLDPLAGIGTGRSRGVELLVQKRLSDVPCYGIMSVTYGRTDFTALDGASRPGLYDQRFILNLSGGYRLDERWEFSTRFRFGTGAPWTPYLPDGTPDVSRYNGERLPAFHSLDVRIDRRWNFSTWNLITYIDVQNVYNRKNIQQYRWDYRNERVIAAGQSIGILPTIGVSAEF